MFLFLFSCRRKLLILLIIVMATEGYHVIQRFAAESIPASSRGSRRTTTYITGRSDIKMSNYNKATIPRN